VGVSGSNFVLSTVMAHYPNPNAAQKKLEELLRTGEFQILKPDLKQHKLEIKH
jgi:hypothetical protein